MCVFQEEIVKKVFPGERIFKMRPVELKREKGNGESSLHRKDIKNYIT